MDIDFILISGLCITLLFCLMNLSRYDSSIKNMYIDDLDILMRPDGVESRASLTTLTHTDIWEDMNVVIGNKMKISEREVVTAYVFIDMNVSNALYDQYEETNHPALSYNTIEVRGIDLTITSFYDVEVE